jgi:hypothetical protein
MNKTQNFAIGTLLVTAAVLVALLIGSVSTNTAYGTSTSVKQGDYIMSAGELSSGLDMVYVINIATRKLNVYFTNKNTWAIDLVDTVDLERVMAD